MQDETVLDRFSPAARDWFTGSFSAPTAAQLGAWTAISAGEHALVVAPTGSGKTLAAFLWALDELARSPVPESVAHRCRVLYISPLKALAVDVERNLRAPLTGLRQAATRLGLPVPDVRVAVRSGDTPAEERRSFTRTPPDILITTPESLFLLLTSRARDALAGVSTVIVDEVHALAGSKRGAHLALTLERLDALLEAPAQRVGLSATVRPVEDVARWLGGSGTRPVAIVQPPADKVFELSVVVPVPDMGDLDALGPPGTPAQGRASEPSLDLSGPAAGEPRRPSIWPHVEERVVDLVTDHRSTLVFANSRRLAERLTARLNEVWTERTTGEPVGPTGSPAEVMAQSGAASGVPPVLARAHHGSVSKEQRAIIEGELKAGRLPAVVATSSLELGIDMGAVDLVVQVESPPSVASGLQRVGRAGHQVGAVSRGVLFPKYRSDLVQTAVVVERMRQGAIEALRVPANPLDVLAQQVVAMVAMDDWSVDELESLIRRAAPFATVTRAVLEAVLDMLSGRYPSDEFAELRPRIVWDRLTGSLTGRPGAQRLAVTSGGTIPDRGLFGVFLASSSAATSGDRGGRRVGELDEEMVYESRVGDVFTLGSTSWRIEDITHDRVLVTPAPGQPGRLPFWHGDAQGRPAELGRAVGAFVRELTALDDARARDRASAAGLDSWATDNLLAYLREQKSATGHVPDDRTIVVERFRDELGDWRVVVHSPFGAQVHAPWALAVAARMRERFGVDVQAMPADDGIVLRLPDVESESLSSGGSGEIADLVTIDPGDVESLVTDMLGGSALFAARFRECAARALLLPRRRPDRRQPLWQQRQRAAQLLEVAARYGSFPIVLETVRECLQDVFDVPGLVNLMRDLAARSVRIIEVTSTEPSPFARSLMFGYVAQFLYEGDSPLAERRAAALALDPALLSELLGRGEGTSLRDLLDPAAVERTEAELQRLAAGRRLVGAEGVADLVRVLGPLTLEELAARTLIERRSEDDLAGPDDVQESLSAVPPVDPVVLRGWLDGLEAARRVIRVRIAGEDRWAAVEDAGRLRDALGTPLPVGVAEVFTEPVSDPLGDLVARHARTHGPFTATALAQRLGLGVAVVLEALRRLVAAGRLVEGELRPIECGGGSGTDYCDREVLRTLRRRSVAALRAEVEPVAAVDLARFLPAWQGITGQGPAARAEPGPVRAENRHPRPAAALRGVEGVLRVVEQLAGALLPASALETLVLPGRVAGYSPGLVEELLSAGEVVWSGHGALPGEDGWISLHPTDIAPLTLAPVDPLFAPGDVGSAVLEVLGGGGAFFFRALSDAVGGPDDAALAEALWELTWAGLITNDSLAALRTRMSGGRTAHRSRRATPRGRYGGRHAGLRAAQAARAAAGGLPARPGMPSRSGPPTATGRWSLLPEREGDPTIRAHAQAEVLLERHGVLTRGAVLAEGVAGAFAGVYRVLSAFEDAGRVRRGYFVEGLGAAQFAGTGAVDRLRASARPVGDDPDSARRTIVLAAADPANPYGAALAWPARPEDSGGHKPGRKAGAVVVLVDGALVLYVERGGRSLLSWSVDPAELQPAADALALAVRDGALGKLTVERADGEDVLGTDQPVTRALAEAGFRATPRGLRMRA
ncbi:MAG: ATP-dependent helicase [Kineosporiaceae bacterium]|nr:ATP-dependent helicase [Kineosporiaceae bacterium]